MKQIMDAWSARMIPAQKYGNKIQDINWMVQYRIKDMISTSYFELRKDAEAFLDLISKKNQNDIR